MPRRLLIYRLKTLWVVSLTWVLFGFVFYLNLIRPGNDLGIRVSGIQFIATFWVIGVLMSAVLIFFLKPAFSGQPTGLAILIKMGITIVLFFVVAFVLLLIYYFLHGPNDLRGYFHDFFTKLVYTNTFASFMVDMAVMMLMTILLLEVSDKYGPGMLRIILSGEYHHPRIENRIFIFLDINESTTIAEDLGHERYFRMQRSFFNDITLTVLANEGQIYQYVGDEVVVSWLNTPENKLKSLKFLRNTYYLVERLAPKYNRRYRHVPRFKAGVHAGEVTAGFIGLIKKDLIYSGDTVNTAARIRSMCNELNESYLLSEDFMHDFHQPFGYEICPIGTMELKGRTEPVQLFSLKFEA